MSDSRVYQVARRTTSRSAHLAMPVSLLILIPVLLPFAGCSGGKDPVVARVGDREITASYYEEKLSKLKQSELPRDENGLPVDTSTLAGKKAFLDVIIHKELLYLKAIELGYEKEEQITGAQKAMLEFQAGTALHNDLFDVPANVITDEELAAYYGRLPEVRECSFMICNFREDAVKARQAIIDGGLWEDVAEEYHDGAMSPQGDYRMQVKWGYWEDNFEQAVFDLKEGEISQPLETVYGYWILRLEGIKQEEIPPLDSFKDRVLTSIRTRKINLNRKEFMKKMHEKYEFKLDEGALWIVYQGLPEGELLLDPDTQKPIPRGDLKPLDIPVQDMDKFLLQYRQGGELVTLTVGDYKVRFDQMNTFQRPKRSELLGGLRMKLTQEVDKLLVIEEAKARGYFEDPRVTEKVGLRLEEMMASKLHSDVVQYDTYVSPDDLEEFWAEHKQEYVVPEGRNGLVVVCADREQADRAREAAQTGTGWTEILEQYGSDENNKQKGGQFEMVYANGSGALKDALFSLEKVDDVSQPTLVNDKWIVAKLTTIEPSYQKQLDEVRNELGQRIKMRRQDEALVKLLADWREQFGVSIDEGNLARLRSWEELTAGIATDQATS